MRHVFLEGSCSCRYDVSDRPLLLQRVLFPLLLEYGATAVAQYLHRSKSRYKLSPHTATRENAALVSLVVLIQRICLNIGPPPGLLHRDAREIDKIVVSGCEGPSIAKLRNVLVV